MLISAKCFSLDTTNLIIISNIVSELAVLKLTKIWSNQMSAMHEMMTVSRKNDPGDFVD